ncbi:SMC family ATPase [Actinomadura macrotermitis]|uniref:Nuclease SbcCD subunit C n=1 Tax=Actinomadura macrotermitis TaxID=2585200 RepID=A0A7K0C3R1_9ACTN|nr:hypothetical protein [Actinomadura macrotermitis]
MRLHRLEITAFGPFSGTEAVDFDALSDAGLFLVQGRTGAGKTSILDAVCFALYGQVPGARNAVKGLRSDHAAPGAAPLVVLETTIRGRRLRVSRSPAWERPKLRGSGTTVQHAKVVLEEHEHGRWTGLSTRLDEAGDLISRLLGMSVDQFKQVAMLPQGEFAGFLRAGADERRKVLERLFAAEVFTDVEKWLAERRVTTGREVAALAATAASIADRIAETTGARPVPRAADPAVAPVGALPAEAAELAAGHDDVRAVTGELLAEAAARLAVTRAALEEGRDLAARQARYAEVRADQELLNARAAEVGDLAARLEAAARAERVVPLVRAVQQRDQRARQARAWAEETRSRIGALVPPGASEDVLAKAERTRRDEIATLEGHRATAARLREIDAARAARRARIERLLPERDRLAAALAELPASIEARRAELERARLAAAGRPGAEAAVQDARRLLDAARRRDALTARLAEAEDDHRAAVDAAQQARDHVQELRQARLEGMAAVLAEDLAPGEPCRVCGATEHPAPAATLGLVPGEEEEARAQQLYETAQAAREKASGQVESLRAERDGHLETAGDKPVETRAENLADAERALAGLDTAAAEAERHASALELLEREQREHRAEHEKTAAALAEHEATDAAEAAEAARLDAELEAARGDDASLEARITRLTGEADALTEALDAVRALTAAADELAAARAQADGAATEQAFRSTQEALEAALDDEDQAPLRDKIRWFDDKKAAVTAQLADPALLAAAAEPAPGLAALEADLRAAEDAHTAAASAADRARARCARLAELRARLDAAVREWRPAAERHEVAAHLAGLASGNSPANRHAMSLSAYVLAARLEQVVAAANERLDRMSGGRYALIHTIDKAAHEGRRKGAGGLGLRVADAWTGQDREPVTLSGGESFITSLSLALGLADVVTAEAGGTEIGTLFVDEGFGTLDEETLDEVMDVLDGLRDGGRAVGIVSHVAELRARIPAQLRVTKERAGSTVRVHI